MRVCRLGFLVAVAVGVGLPVAGAEEDAAVKADLAALKGAWRITKMQANGEVPPPGFIEQLQLEFGDTTVSLKLAQRKETCIFKIDPKVNPKTLDMSPETNKEVNVLGIYELNGDVLKICWSKKGPRPNAFTANAGEDRLLLELARIK